MKKNLLRIGISTVIIIAFVFGIAFAAAASWKVVIKVKGDVESLKQGQTVWEKIWQSRMLKDGDKAKTGADSQAKIKFSDQSLVLIGSNTMVEISQFNVTDNLRTSKMKLDFGKIRAFVSKFMNGGSTFEVTTPNAVLAARGTEFYVEQIETPATSYFSTKLFASTSMQNLIGAQTSGDTKLAVFSGKVLVTSSIERYVVEAGNTAIITPQGSVYINPSSFAFPTTIPAVPGGDADLTHPKQSISSEAPVAPPAPPLFNPSASPAPAPAPCPGGG